MFRLFILYAILIFAKKAPKLISDLLNLNKDGESVGLKGLNIKNKMGEAALVGDKVKKGMLYAEGKAKGRAAGFASGFINTKGDLKAKLIGGVKGGVTGGKQAGKQAVANGNTKGIMKGAYQKVSPLARNGRPTIWDNVKGQVGEKVGDFRDKFSDYGFKGYSSTEASNQADFQKLNSRLISMYGRSKANDIINSIGPIDFANGDNYQTARGKIKKYTEAFDSANASAAEPSFVKQNIYEARKKVYEKINGYEQQILSAKQSIDPSTQQALSQREAMNTELSEIHQQQLTIDNNLRTAREALNNASTPEMRQNIENEINGYLSTKTNLEQEELKLQRTIQGCEAQITSDSNYIQIQNTIDLLEQQKEKVFQDAKADHVFEANGGSGLNLGVAAVEINGATISDISGLNAVISDEVGKNEKLLNIVNEEIKEAGKDPEPAKDNGK